MLKINEPIPELDVEFLQKKRRTDSKYSLYVFYRGFHCPICKKYLEELNEKADELDALGVSEITAISSDETLIAAKTRDNWQMYNMQIAYNLSEKSMQDWGLYISEKIQDNEPQFFNEPAVFLVKQDDNKLVYANYSSMPFARPRFEDIVDGLKMMKENDYPARGTKFPS